MFFKKSLVILTILIIFLCCFNSVNASDNITIDNDEPVSVENNVALNNGGNEHFNSDERVYYNPNNKEIVNLSESECCSFIIQEKNGETIYAFRQDGKLNGNGIQINAQNWNGLNILKQEIDDVDSVKEYFFHTIITENGWVIGQGGSQYDDASRSIEQIAAAMVLSNDISYNSLQQIQGVLSRFGYGHFIIKAPDGRYGISFVDAILTGTLQEGQYMVIPNYYSYYAKGNYKNYASNPVDAIILICSYDMSGVNRRNLITYDYKVKETANGVFNGVDVYATNDNGLNAGLHTAGIVTHVIFKGQYFPPSAIPETSGKNLLGTHIFESQYYGKSISLLESQSNILIGKELSLKYRINFLSSQRTVVFNLGNNVDFVRASASAGSYNYDTNQHKLYWQIPASNGVKDISIVVKPKAKGNYNVHAHIEGMTEVNDFSYYATDYGVDLYSEDVDKYKGGNEKLVAFLYDKSGVPLVGEKVAFQVNGQTYYREVTKDGYASLAINLASGDYNVKISYNGNIGKNQTNAKVKVRTTLFGEDIVKYYKNGTQFYASFLDTDGGPLKNSEVKFNINGIIYTRMTDNEGIAKLNINLPPSKYIITSINAKTGEKTSNSITVKQVLVENHDLVKYYRNESKYSVKVLDGQGHPLSGVDVTFNINGVFYKRLSDEEGIARLSINLPPNNYIITASYNGVSVSNNVLVLNRLMANDMVMKYNDGSKFKVTTLNEQGGLLKGENVTFNINGVFYNRTVEESGMAKLNINLLPGKYIITSYWNHYAQSNTITILE